MNVHAANLRATAHAGDASEARRSRFGAGEIQKLKERDNVTNLWHLGIVYAVMSATIAVSVWQLSAVGAGEISFWWAIPTALIAVLVIGASQHQLGGAIHEGTHYMLFANRTFSELASDWLAAFPIYTSTYAFRLHHLAHHQFVNDPVRDPNFDQAKESGHWLDFPVAHLDFAWAVLKLLWLPNTVRYIIARAKYSAIGVDTNPYADTAHKGSPWAIRNGVLFAVGAPAVAISLVLFEHAGLALAIVPAMWVAIVGYYLLIPDVHFPQSKIDPVISHRWTAIGRMTWLGVVYTALTAIEYATSAPAWGYYGLLWLLPLFTTFPLFMILREWLQHGNADRGRITNTRIILESNPLVRYAVYPWGMDYHLPHHLYASVPHYKLKALHEVLLRDPEYREKGVIAEGWWTPNGESGLPTILDILGPAYAGTSKEKHVDDATLELADVNDKAGLQKHIEASRA